MTKLFKYNELSERAKERAREWYRSTNWYYDGFDLVVEQWHELAKALGFVVDSGPWWDLDQGTFKIGRGRFYRTFDDELDFLEREYASNPDVLSIIREIRPIHWNFKASIENGRVGEFEIPVDYDMEPRSDDEEEWEAYYSQLKKLAEEGAERLKDALSELQYLALKWLQEIETEEAIEEAMETYGWLFHEDGTPEEDDTSE